MYGGRRVKGMGGSNPTDARHNLFSHAQREKKKNRPEAVIAHLSLSTPRSTTPSHQQVPNTRLHTPEGEDALPQHAVPLDREGDQAAGLDDYIYFKLITEIPRGNDGEISHLP